MIVEVKIKLSKQSVNYSAGGFADDINIICNGDSGSIQRIFEQDE